MTEERAGESASWPGWVAAALAVLANAWVLGLDFAADDYSFLRRVPERFVPEPWITEEPCSGASLWYREVTVPVPGRYIFRPALWSLWWLLAHASGGASPVLFHGAVLLAHAGATLLLFRVLRPGAGSFAARAAALAFALAPGSMQAVAWVSATGDTMGVLFVLASALAVQRGRRVGGVGADLLAGLTFALAVASKESLLYLGPAVLLAGWLVPRGDRPSPLWRLALCFALPFAGFVAGRHAYLGTWSTPWSLVSLPFEGRPEIDFLGQFLAPWDAGGPDPWVVKAARALAPNEARTVLRILGAGIVLLPIVAGALVLPRRVVPRMGVTLVCLAIALIPIARFFLKDIGVLQSNGIARAAYPLSALVAAMVAFGLDGVRTAPRISRAALVVPLLLWEASFLVHVARVEQASSGDTRLRRSSLAAIVAQSPPDTWFVAIEGGEPGEVHNGFFIEDAFQKPFVERPVPVTWIPRGDPDVWERVPRCVYEHQGPVQVVTWDARAGYRPAGPPVSDLLRPGPDPRREAPAIAIVAPPAFSTYERKMPAIEWTPVPGAAEYLVRLRLHVRRTKHVAEAEVRVGSSRVSFEPDLPVLFEGNPIRWREADAALSSIPRGLWIEAELQVLAFDAPGLRLDASASRATRHPGLVGLSEWRSISLEPEYR
jgi:hypothetical protein